MTPPKYYISWDHVSMNLISRVYPLIMTPPKYYIPWDKQAMAARNITFEQILDEKPTLDELCEHIRIGSKWYQLGILLKLDPKKLDDIHKLPEVSTYKATKMFELWLDTNPHATRRQVVDALRKEVIKEITIAHEYEKTLGKSISAASE